MNIDLKIKRDALHYRRLKKKYIKDLYFAKKIDNPDEDDLGYIELLKEWINQCDNELRKLGVR